MIHLSTRCSSMFAAVIVLAALAPTLAAALTPAQGVILSA